MLTNLDNANFDQHEADALEFSFSRCDDDILSPFEPGFLISSETDFGPTLNFRDIDKCINDPFSLNMDYRKIECDPNSLNNIFDVTIDLLSPIGNLCPPSVSGCSCPIPAISITQQQQMGDSQSLSAQSPVPPAERRISFEEAYMDENLYICPQALNLLPEKYWANQPQNILFSQMVNGYFKLNRTQYSTFMLKLYNLLLIASSMPMLERAVGVRWVNNNVIEVSRSGIINMFNVRDNTVDGSMFHRQGNFPTHQFVEINNNNFLKYNFFEFPLIEKIPGDTKFFAHDPGVFTRRPMTETELKSIKYSNEAKKNYRSKQEMKCSNSTFNCS